MRKLYFLKTMLLLCALVVGSGSVWADKTYKLTKVTSVSADNKYVFERNSHVLDNYVSSKALQTTDTYAKTGLAGTESYVWTLESATDGYYMKNVSLNSNQYLNNTSKTDMSFGSKTSVWTFTFSDGVALIANSSNSDRYIGETTSGANTYKAYATSNMGYGHDFTVYLVEEEVGVTDLTIESAPNKIRYEVGETLDMTGFELNADGTTVTSGYTMTIGGSAIENGDALNTAGKQIITVSYGGQTVNQEISVGAVTGISISTAPTKTTYLDGETFSADGMVVTASLSTGGENPNTWTKAVTGYTISPDGVLSTTDTKVTITYAGQTAEQSITVNPIALTSIGISLSSVTIEKTKTKTLTPIFTPTNASNKNVTWGSDDTSVATVTAAGVVTAVSVGTANITVTAEDGGFTATCVVTVVTKKGDINNPYTVAEVIGQASATTFGNDVYVTGYIVGCANNNKCYKTTSASFVQTNLLLADTPDVSFTEGVLITNTSGIIPVELPNTNNGVLRTNWGPSNKPYNIGVAKVVIKGNCESYFSTKGVKGTSEITKVAENVTISAAGMATYYTDCALDFSEFTDMYAYTATVSGDKVNFTRVNKVPANTAVLLRNPNGAFAASHDVPVTDSPESVTSALTGTLTNIASLATTSGSSTNYVLNTGANGVGFYYANGLPVGMHKAYLSVAGGGARTFIGFDNETDGVSATLVNSEERIVNVYDLQGRRVESSIFNSQSSILKKGLYIVNGKKVIK